MERHLLHVRRSLSFLLTPLRLLYRSSGCNYLYLFNPAPFAGLPALAVVALRRVQPDQMPPPNCTNSEAAPQTTALLYF